MALTSSIIWKNADGTVGILKPTESGRHTGESDQVFLNRIISSVAPVGARIIVDASIPADVDFVAAEAKARTGVVTTAKAIALAKIADMANDDSDPVWQAIKIILRRLKAANIP